MDLAKAGLAASGREQSLGAQLCGGLLINLKKPRTGGSQKSSRATFAQLISHHTQEHSQALWTTSGRPVTCPTSHCFGLGCLQPRPWALQACDERGLSACPTLS